MKIEVLQEQFIEGLQIVSRAVASRAQLPALSHVLIEATKEGITLSATDLEIGIKTKVAAKVIVEGEVCVPAKMFGEFLGSLNPGKVELSSEGTKVTLTAPGYNGKFQAIETQEFPHIPAIVTGGEICELPVSSLTGSIERVIFACAKDSLRPVLTGILLEFEQKKIRFVTTDGFRLAIEELAMVAKKEQPPLLVPARAVMEAVRLTGSEKVILGYIESTNQIYFKVGETLVVSQLLAGNFPDYSKILPKEFDTELTASKDELLQAIKACYIFARDNSNMVKWGASQGKLVLKSSSPERGECRVEVPITLEGEPLEITYNAKYILEYLMIVGGERVWMGMGDKLAPGMMREERGKGGQYVVMPINA